MRTALSFAFGTGATVALLVACSGSSDVNIPGATNTDTTFQDSGSDPPTKDAGKDPTDSGIVCGPCETPPPDPSCTGTGPCQCGPYTCPDSGTTTDAGSDECVWSANANPCGAGKYCDTSGSNKACGKGKCVAVGVGTSTTRNPVCGCDGVTYWNEAVAAKSGMSLSKKGACTGGDQKTCGGLGNMVCPNGASCNYRLGSDDACKVADASGTCWVTPATCPPLGFGLTKGHVCNAIQCSDECTLIKGEQPWVPQGQPSLCQ